MRSNTITFDLRGCIVLVLSQPTAFVVAEPSCEISTRRAAEVHTETWVQHALTARREVLSTHRSCSGGVSCWMLAAALTESMLGHTRWHARLGEHTVCGHPDCQALQSEVRQG